MFYCVNDESHVCLGCLYFQLGCLMPPQDVWEIKKSKFRLINYSSCLWYITYLLPSLLACRDMCLVVSILCFLLFLPVFFQSVEDHVAFVITVPTALAIFLAVFVLVCIESIFKKLLRVFSLVIWACLVAMGYLFMFSGGIVCPWDQVRQRDEFCGEFICCRITMWYILCFIWCVSAVLLYSFTWRRI